MTFDPFASPPRPADVGVSPAARTASTAPAWAPPKTSSGVGRRILIIVGTIVAIGAIPRLVELWDRTKVESVWSTWTAPERALVCWGRDGAEQFGGAGLEGIPREVLNSNCLLGEAQVVTAHAPLGEATERKWLELAKSEYEDKPLTPEELGLTDADVTTLCAIDRDDLGDNIDPDFFVMPWEGTAYEPSHEFVVDMIQVNWDALCS